MAARWASKVQLTAVYTLQLGWRLVSKRLLLELGAGTQESTVESVALLGQGG